MIRPLLAILTLAPAGMAGAFELVLPVDCTLGETCHIQNYFDRDAGAGWQDVGCGALSYDGHDGTDFALPTVAAMRAGVDVLAPAAGIVRGVRDGMPDISRDDPAAPPLEGRDCVNGVAIDHGKVERYSARLTLDVTPALRTRIKLAAFDRGVTMAKMLREVLEQRATS